MSSSSATNEPSVLPRATALQRGRRSSRDRISNQEEWEDEPDDDSGLSTPRRRGGGERTSRRTTVQAVPYTTSSSSAIGSPGKSPRGSRRRNAPQRQPIRTLVPLTPSNPARPLKRSGTTSFMPSATLVLSLLGAGLRLSLTILGIIIAPFLPFLLPIVFYLLGFLLIGLAASFLLPHLPYIFSRGIAYLIRRSFPSSFLQYSWNSLGITPDVALARGAALLPLRSLATPACALTGYACHLSLLSRTDAKGEYISLAGPLWRSPDVDVAGVARNLTKDVKGARDIFESIAMLSDGAMMDRLGYVRIWELGAAVASGSDLEAKDMLAQQLLELGDDSRDLSDDLVNINAMAVNAFTWIHWEFAALVKTLSLPPASRPDSATLARSLNFQLTRLSDALGKIHSAASLANVVASRGSEKGRHVRNRLSAISASLAHEKQREPGWKHAVDRANHFLIGGDLSRSALLSRDLSLTETTISSLNELVHGLENSRSSIKGFRDQIGFFDASMMGFHLGLSGRSGVGVEDEVRVLGEVVEEFGRAIGRAKDRGLPNGDGARLRLEGF